MFAAPYFLIGITAGIIPILIHLIYRKRAPQILFSTLRFLRISAQKTARRRRIEDLMLLVFRVLLFSLLAMGLARPFLRAGALLTSNASVQAVIVLDNSLSMAATEGDKTAYGRAKETAQEILRDLPPGSKAALILTNASPRPETLSSDVPALFDAAANSEPAPARADLFGALACAYKLLGPLREPNREIYVISDMQKAAWEGKWLPPQGEEVNAIHLILVSVRGKADRNLAVTGAELRIRGAAVGARGTIEAEIENSSGEDEANLPVSLQINGQRVAEQVLAVPAHSKTAATFSHVFAQAGAATGAVEIKVDDCIESDNRRLFAADIGARTTVVIVKEQTAPISFLDPAFYLAVALDARISSGIVLSQVEHPRLAEAKLRGASVVFLVDLKKPSPAEIKALTEYVESGGRLVIFPGDNSAPGDFPLALVPASFLKTIGNSEKRDQFSAMGKVDLDHPVFKPFLGLPPSAFAGVHVHKYMDLGVPSGGDGRVLAYLDNGKPLLVERGLGRGKVMMFATAADASWSNLPLKRIFLPMIHQMVHHLAEEESRRADYIAGAPVRLALPKEAEGKALDVTDPMGRIKRIQPAESAGLTMAVYEDTDLLGRYSWNVESKPDVKGVFVVNPDPRESDLSPIAPADVARQIAVGHAHVALAPQEVGKIVTQIREGIQLRDMLLAVVIAIAVVECFLANRKKPVPDKPAEQAGGVTP